MSLIGLPQKDPQDDIPPPRWQDQFTQHQDFKVQLVVSVAFGLSAFISFCILRTKWTELYSARKKQSNAASRLPDLPKSLFGWIPVLYRISEEEVLASAGLDAFAFLSFFGYAARYLSITLFFSLAVILPVNYKYSPELPTSPGNSTTFGAYVLNLYPEEVGSDKKKTNSPNTMYLWVYAFFTWFFTGVAVYLLIMETKKIIRIRQAYLGNQSTVTDRTIRLSGIPIDMRSEESILTFIEELGIGKVDSVMLCRNWAALDKLMDERMQCLRRLEESWAVYLGHRHRLHDTHSASDYRPAGPANGHDSEHAALLSNAEMDRAHSGSHRRKRPMHTIRYGILKLQGKNVDAMDYFEEKLRKIDDKIKVIRQTEFQPTPLAFVTMESTAASQMAIQAILDPNPGQFIASPAPPAADVVWRNTYLSRNHRMFRSWSIMVVIGFLSVFWAALLIPIAGLLSIEVIDRFLPGLASALDAHPLVRSLVQSVLPTLVFSLLGIAVQYFYDWLSNKQGMTSQGDVELSVISKNYFFQFFNLFIVFTIWGSASNFYDYWKYLKDLLQDTTSIAYAVAKSLEQLIPFYTNLIVLQGLGLLPFRLLEFGAVFMYPFWLISAKTPRDHAELAKPPIFSYGFFLPQTILIFVMCIIYSVLPRSWMITLFGLIYFLIGGFIYKYQLLYAMDHRQHSTGRAWPMICNRIFVGLVVFQIAMTGILALDSALTASACIIPLIVATIWFTVWFQRTFHPLMTFIALRSINSAGTPDLPSPNESTWDRYTDLDGFVDTESITGLGYVNPNLNSPLQATWIKKSGHRGSGV